VRKWPEHLEKMSSLSDIGRHWLSTKSPRHEAGILSFVGSGLSVVPKPQSIPRPNRFPRASGAPAKSERILYGRLGWSAKIASRKGLSRVSKPLPDHIALLRSVVPHRAFFKKNLIISVIALFLLLPCPGALASWWLNPLLRSVSLPKGHGNGILFVQWYRKTKFWMR
jgi:hypothetical protein